MNNSNKNYFTAAILILLGIMFLGREFNLFSFHWGDIARFWPVLLIIIGLNIIFGNKTNGSASWIFFVLLILAIPLGIVRKCENKWDNNNNWNHRNWDGENDNEKDNDDNNDDEDDDENDKKELKSETNSIYSKSQSIIEDMEPSIKAAKLTMESGLAGIEIEGTTSKLFEADTKSTISEFQMTNTVKNGVANLNFRMEDSGKKNKIEFDSDSDDDIKNEAKIKLNSTIEWDMDYKFGIAGANLDLSPFNVKNIDIETGISGVEIKLGEKASNTDLNINAGLAGIKIKVPENVGVRIKADEFLNSNHFNDFKKESSGYFVSPGYEKTSKKITITYKGAFSSFDVVRY
jgi:hypothetical protein